MRKIILAALALAIVGCYAKPDKPAELPQSSGTADMDLNRPSLSDMPSTPTVTESTPAAAVPESAAAAGGG